MGRLVLTSQSEDGRAPWGDVAVAVRSFRGGAYDR